MSIRSRVSILALTLLLTSSAPVLAAGADDFWVGVWEITIDGRDKETPYIETAFLSITKSGKQHKLTYLNVLWEEVQTSWVKIEPKRLRLSSMPKARQVELELVPAGNGKVTGKWRLLHPQLPINLPVYGVKRLAVATGLKPLAFESQADVNRVVDFNGFLLKKAPRDTFEKFKKFWVSSVDPLYLALVHDLVYPAGATPEASDQKLRTIFALLSNPQFQQQADRLATEAKAVESTIRTKQPALFADNPIVLMPSLVDEPVWMNYVARKLVIRVDTPRICEMHQGEELKALLGYHLLRMRLWGILPGAENRLDAVMIREGIAARLAVSLGLAKTPEQCFGLPQNVLNHPAERLKIRRRVLANHLQTGSRQVVKDLLEAKTPATQEALQTAYQFGDRIVSRFAVAEIVSMRPERLGGLLLDFLKE